ncbi:N-acetylglucosamine-6-phosphate deacetylase [Aquipuribacter hungaricus]|uniref:N-acetylglucosamine-6-phosphate deacetylase n=2 Tax=Aquipuribacter hungaricus TaxID=545624 RepID=A0ABV7WGW9_9MICO
MTVLRGPAVLADDVLADAVVRLEGGRVVEVRPARSGDPAAAGTLLPGLVDVHCHGGGGASFATDDPDEADAAAGFHLDRGTTTVVASLVTDGPGTLLAQCRLLAGLCGDGGPVAGIHLEGPFLSPARRGAHPAHLLLPPDPAVLAGLLAAGAGHVRHVTLAPELPGYAACAALVRGAGAVVALGHSDADHATAAAAFAAGAGSATHLFNAMRPWGHRDSSVASAALQAAAGHAAVVELVADGIHVDAGTVAAVLALVPGRVALVSDAVPPAGLPDGDHVLGAVGIQVRDGVARTVDGAVAGGSGALLDVLRFAVQQAGVPLPVAAAAASRVPAALLGLDRSSGAGRLAPGARADVLVVDDDLRPVQVWRAGRRHR